MKMPSIVEPKGFSLYSSVIFTQEYSRGKRDERFIGSLPKEDVGIANLLWNVNHFGQKLSWTVFFPKRNNLSMSIENATISLRRQRNTVLFYESQTNYTPLET